MSEPWILFAIVGGAVLFLGGRLMIGICLPDTHWLNSWADSDGDGWWDGDGDCGD